MKFKIFKDEDKGNHKFILELSDWDLIKLPVGKLKFFPDVSNKDISSSLFGLYMMAVAIEKEIRKEKKDGERNKKEKRWR